MSAESTRTPRGGVIAWTVGTAALAVLGAIVVGLFYYKWSGALHIVGGAASTGSTSLRAEPYFGEGVLTATLNYLKKVGLALAFGVLIGATLRVAIPAERVARALGGRGAVSMLRGAAAGMPLMLCSCCVTPIFSSLHRRGARLGPALAVMLAAPGLNVAALALTFVLVPARFGLVRIGAALVLVFGAAALLGRLYEGHRRARGESEACPVPAEEPLTTQNVFSRWLRSIGEMTLATVPLVVVGVAMSSMLGGGVGYFAGKGAVVAVLGVTLLATLVALPTFLEIPIALTLFAVGAPGPALGVLIAGPIVNLPSLFVLARETSVHVSISLFLAVWLVASASGICLI